MQRHHATSCTSAVSNNNTNALGGVGGGGGGVGFSGRDSSRGDSLSTSSLSSNFAINSRRVSLILPYRLKCEKEPLNSRLGPPDFYPQTFNCPEETLTKEYVQSGYRETVEGLEEAKEISVSQVNTFTKPGLFKCKEAIRKRLRAINESRAQKRKAGQVYGDPLYGGLLSKSSVYPEQKSCGEDFKKRWIEGLSQYHKSLRSLADHVPHGYRKKMLFEVLIKNNVPLLRATWFIKVTYLNQIKPTSSSVSPAAADRNQLSRSELWTKDVTDYLQCLLDEHFSRSHSQSTPPNRDRPQMLYAGSAQRSSDPALLLTDGEEPSLHFKWWYVVRILNWHRSEGLILSSHIIDWMFVQFQDRDLLQTMQFLLPVIYGVLEPLALCQTYVRKLVDVTLRFLRERHREGSDVVDNAQRTYASSAVVEILQYLILSVPDTFVALDCFPLPNCLVVPVQSDGYLFPYTSPDGGRPKIDPLRVPHIPCVKISETKYPSSCFYRIVSSIQKRALYLTKAASPGCSGQNVPKAVQALDKALLEGDVLDAYKFLFECFCSYVGEDWIAEVSPCLKSSLKWIRSVGSPLVYSVFLLCEWCTSDLRDFRSAPLHDVKFSGRKDFSQIYVAVRLLKLKMQEMQRSEKSNKGCEGNSVWRSLGKVSVDTPELFESTGPLHDIIVYWIDQHEVHKKGEGFKRVQLFLTELTRSGIFTPQGYIRQLLTSGIMDNSEPVSNMDRRRRHYRILKQLPSLCMHDVFNEAQIDDTSLLEDAMHIYSNERRLVLLGLLDNEHKRFDSSVVSSKKRRKYQVSQIDQPLTPVHQLKIVQPSKFALNENKKNKADLEEIKVSIVELLLLPKFSGDAGIGSLLTLKRAALLISSKSDVVEGTPGCDECRRAKRQKVEEENLSLLPRSSSNSLIDDSWWSRKDSKSLDALKVDQPIKPTKQAPRGRQKLVRKTQSLAQLAAARIEGSQGASTSHVCDSTVVCPHHRTGLEGDTSKSADIGKVVSGADIMSIRKMLNSLKCVEKRRISDWILNTIKKVVEMTEKAYTKTGPTNSPSSADEKISSNWKLGEDELSVILYLMDLCDDIPSTIKFLIWLLPKAQSSVSTPIHAGRNMMMPRTVESPACEVRESFILSAIRRYENFLVAVDLIPEVLSTAMQRAASILASNGRLSGCATFLYARYLLKRYGSVSSVLDWEKNCKPTCDKRLFAELESGRLQNGDISFSLAVPAGVEDPDEFIRKKITGNRLSRTGMTMSNIVPKYVDDAVHRLFGKERKLFGAGAQKNAVIDKWDEGYQIAQQIVIGLMDCIRQTGGAAQEGDPSLVASAVSAIVGNVGQAIAKMPDFTPVNIHSNFPAPTGSLSFARRVLRIHINCLCLLKEALGERHSRAFEIALAAEALSALTGVLLPGKGARGQFQLSPDTHEYNVNSTNDVPNNSTKVALGRATKTVAAVSALVIGAVIHGVANLERMVSVFRFREGLDLMQFARSSKTHSNGNASSAGILKVENSLESYIHWFRLLVGNCRTVCDGLIVELLGEPSVLALSRMQRTLPLNLVLPPAYSLFAFLIWRPFVFSVSLGNREEIPQLLQSLTMAVDDVMKHTPFRDVCLRDTHGFFDLLTTDVTDSEFASFLELNGSDRHLKVRAFIPLRARLFLNALIDCKIPHSVLNDGSRVSGIADPKLPHAETETKIADRLVRALDALQPAKFHWQWVELRLFLSEQTLTEKLDSNDLQSIADAIQSLSPNPDKGGPLENENSLIPIVLTRLLVRPDAAPLLSEVVHLFGRSLEESMLFDVKWFLEGQDVLFGRKSIRERLLNIAESKGFSTRGQLRKFWGWCHLGSDSRSSCREKRRLETPSVEEGEVIEEDCKKNVKGAAKVDNGGLNTNQQFVTERALVELVLPCIDRCSDDSRNRLATELIKQMNSIEQQISGVTFGFSKQAGSSPSGTEGFSYKAITRKSLKGGSPGLSRQAATQAVDPTPSSPAALRASVSLRLQLLLRLLSNICEDGDSSSRSSRFTLASIVLRLLGSRVVYEDMDSSFIPGQGFPVKEAELQIKTCADVSVGLSGENVFDWLLVMLHALMSSSWPSWLRQRTSSKSSLSAKHFSGFDRENLESLQGELDHMQLPDAIKWRIQAAMPILEPNSKSNVSCHLPSVSSVALSSLQPSPVGPFPKNSTSSARNALSGAIVGKSKSPALLPDLEVDPWLLLEDGAGSGPSSSPVAVMGGGDHANLKASSWLKGAVRVRRMNLAYIVAVDDNS